MSIIESFILGIIQGLTEFLPISSSGHIELGKALLGINITKDLLFSIILHVATALSTMIIFRKKIIDIFRNVLKFEKSSIDYTLKIIISMIPVGIVGIFLKDQIKNLFKQQIRLVGIMLLITGLLLLFTYFFKQKQKKEVSYFQAFIIGIAQMIAVLPGISRSGATIATGLILGIDRKKATDFSFLMVLLPIMGGTFLELKDFLEQDTIHHSISIQALITGFLAAFITGLFACQWMIKLVKANKLFFFSAYCFIVGTLALFLH